MCKIEIDKKNVEAAYKVANDDTKKVLDALFGKVAKSNTPNLDDYKSIKTYEDACEALEIIPILSEDRNKALCAEFPDHYDFRQNMPKHIIALMKLETISRAIWGRNWKPNPNANGCDVYYYPWFALYTQSEIDNISEENRGALLAADALTGASAGFGCLTASNRSSDSGASYGFRLCQDTEEKAKYFGKQFIDLWAEYLAFNFTVGGKIK